MKFRAEISWKKLVTFFVFSAWARVKQSRVARGLSRCVISSATNHHWLSSAMPDDVTAMTYQIYLGDRTFSSWSLRGWLMLDSFDLPYQIHMVGLYSGSMAQDLAHLAPARMVPTLQLPDGTAVGETMAIGETLAERHPDAGLWPSDPAQRATARWLSAEMCAGFGALRSACPMQLLHVYEGFEVDEAVKQDLARIELLWTHARDMADEGPWLFGAWSLADVFFAPVCARIVGYDLPVSDAAREYCLKVLERDDLRHWRREGQKVSYDPVPYAMDLKTRPWPVAD
jgi:glutathione S-transferase